MASRSTAKGIVPVLRADDAGFEAAFEKLVRRRDDGAADVDKVVRRILDRVREGGDEELFACIRKYDGVSLTRVEVQPEEFEEAGERIDPADRAALGKAAMRVREFHRKRIPSSWEVREEGGGIFGHRVRPLQRAGIYVPGGKAVYPSTVIMNAIPASVVEVPEIIMATPAGPDGRVRPEVLIAAKVAGVHRVFKMGGAHAIAALAYGTDSVPRVDKIVGPGNVYVATAKRMVFGEVDIDGEAGPTEVMVIADRTATPAWVASDLISQAEHDELAQSILVTPVKNLVARVQDQIARQLKTLDRAKIARRSLSTRGALVVARDIDHCLELANRYAPEHLQVAVDERDVDRVVDTLRNAGEILIGQHTPFSAANFVIGCPASLPTSGFAHVSSGITANAFLKRTAIARADAGALARMAPSIIALADHEGFPAHAAALRRRG